MKNSFYFPNLTKNDSFNKTIQLNKTLYSNKKNLSLLNIKNYNFIKA